MQRHDVVPSAIAMSSLILAFTTSGQCKRALALLTTSAARELDIVMDSFGTIFMESEKQCMLHIKVILLSNVGEVHSDTLDAEHLPQIRAGVLSFAEMLDRMPCLQRQ